MNTELSVTERFYNLKTREDVADILGINEKSLRFFLYKIRPEKMYSSFTIPKKNGKSREIHAPKPPLLNVQKKLASILSCVYKPKICAYGFIKGKSIVSHAEQHTQKMLLLNIDLKDFFSQIHFGRIRGMLIKPPYSIGLEAATTIAQIACYNGKLPQGAPSSPVLTNMICVPLDNQLMKLSKTRGYTYTRYADDITISTYKKSFDKDIISLEGEKVILGAKLTEVFKKNNFEINPDKVILRSQQMRQEVTGLTVNRFPNLRRSYIKQLRAILHSSDKYGLYLAAKTFVKSGNSNNAHIFDIIDDETKKDEIVDWFKKVLVGKINYIKQVKGPESITFLSFAKRYNEITETEYFVTEALDRLSSLIKHNTFVIEYGDDENYYQGSAFCLPEYGLLTSYHVTEKCHSSFSVKKVDNRKPIEVCVVNHEADCITENHDTDFSLYAISFPSTPFSFEIGNSEILQIGSEVIVVGYPKYVMGNTAYIQRCQITALKNYLGGPLYLVDGILAHGSSGGVVLNSEYKVVGLIKAGVDSYEEMDINENRGFVPLYEIISKIDEGNRSISN